MSVLLKPYDSVWHRPLGEAASTWRTASMYSGSFPAQSVDVVVTSAAVQPRIQYSRYQDSLSPAAYLE